MTSEPCILLCLKQVKTSPRVRADGSRAETGAVFNPDDETALEAALTLAGASGARVTALTMGPPSAERVLREALARGAHDAVLVSSPVLAGSDTLATARTLADAVRTLAPALVVCGRRAADGDTGQVPPMLAALLGVPFFPDLLRFPLPERSCADAPCAVVTFARADTLRKPSIAGLRRARAAGIRVLAPENAHPSLTRVVRSTVLTRETRRTRELTAEAALELLRTPPLPRTPAPPPAPPCAPPCAGACWMLELPIPAAYALGYPVELLHLPRLPVRECAEHLAGLVRAEAPAVVLAPATPLCRAVLPYAAALCGCGMTADCTALRREDGALVQIRPAFQGDVLAEIVSASRPVFATVRVPDTARVTLAGGAGLGSRAMFARLTRIAEALGADCGATRAAVDAGYAPYPMQIGQSGRFVTPALYAGIGVSGAPQHLAGVHGGTRLCVNPDRAAPLLDVSDFSVRARAEEVFDVWERLLGL